MTTVYPIQVFYWLKFRASYAEHTPRMSSWPAVHSQRTHFFTQCPHIQNLGYACKINLGRQSLSDSKFSRKASTRALRFCSLGHYISYRFAIARHSRLRSWNIYIIHVLGFRPRLPLLRRSPILDGISQACGLRKTKTLIFDTKGCFAFWLYFT